MNMPALRNEFHLAALLASAALTACNASQSGTNTGNPIDGTAGGAAAVPHGAKLYKSDLAREEPAVSETDRALLGTGNRAFAFDLYRKLSEGAAENLFFSPFSISVALAMTYPGADGTTEAEMRSTLHFDLPESSLHRAFNGTLQALDARPLELAEGASGAGFELRLVNQAWGQEGYPFLPSYLDILAQNYGAGLYAVDFRESDETRKCINGWVAGQTEERVKNLLPHGALTADTRLVLTNAIYFKGNWLLQFDPEDTTEAVFHAESGDRSVRMMHNLIDARFADGPGYRALELPYLSHAVRMLLVLPEAGDLPSWTAGFDAATFADILGNLREHEVRVALPKFSFESENRLKVPLAALGMVEPFARSADFSGIAGGVEPLYVDEVYHKAFVAVDEVGTEAAAATAVVVNTDSAKPRTEIVFDRPFVFLIYDAPTGQILFMGNVADPG